MGTVKRVMKLEAQSCGQLPQMFLFHSRSLTHGHSVSPRQRTSGRQEGRGCCRGESICGGIKRDHHESLGRACRWAPKVGFGALVCCGFRSLSEAVLSVLLNSETEVLLVIPRQCYPCRKTERQTRATGTYHCYCFCRL